METDDYLRFALSFVLVIGLILLAGALFRRFADRMPSLGGTRKGPRRLRVVETLTLDPRRRLVLVRRDDVEHLLLLGGSTDVHLGATPAPTTDAGDAGEATPGTVLTAQGTKP